MEIKKKKTVSLYMLFLKYLAAFFLWTLLLFASLVVVFGICLWSGFILPANYGEWAVEQLEAQISENEIFDEEIIPFTCTYVLLNNKGNIISTDMTLEEALRAKEGNMSYGVYSKYIKCRDSVCIICYDMCAHFSSPVLHRWFPNPEIFVAIVFIIGFFLIAVVIAISFGKRLTKELEPIIEAANAIKNQQLQQNFNIRATKINEFNTVLDSIQDLSVALKASLKEQWNLEQHRKMQLSAITHDIKTPLTIIRGNTELLLETDISQENIELLQYIYKSSDRVERYLELLMETAKAENNQLFNPKSFLVSECVDEIKEQAKAGCTRKNILFISDVSIEPENAVFCGDRELIIRAVSNIIDNAIEHTPLNEQLEFKVITNTKKLIFKVSDNGNGFSKNSLTYATKQFYTECEARAGKHYGLGLYIADSVAEKHSGKLLIENKKEGCGAEVTLIINSCV